VGQSLLLVNVNFTILLKQLNENPNAVLLIKESKELLTQSMENLTSLSRSMNPDRIVEMGVFKAITEELKQLSDKKLFEIDIHIPQIFQDTIQLKPDLQLVIFRIYQEAVKNIIKYAEATKIKFEVEKSENKLIISIIDNGKGFDTTGLSSVSGIGLRNMQKRLAIFGGNVTVKSTINEGTCIQLIVSYN
jgi:signal transduction histidine kinase